MKTGVKASFRPSDPALARARNQKRDQNEALGRLKEQREKKERAKEANKSSGPLNVGDYFSSDSEGEDEDDSRNNLASSDSDSGKATLVSFPALIFL